jgi:hypothetical protein
MTVRSVSFLLTHHGYAPRPTLPWRGRVGGRQADGVG